MVEQWAYINYDSARVAEARGYAADLRQANAEIQKGNAVIEDLYRDLVKTEDNLGFKTAEAQALRMALRSLIADGSLDQEKANIKYKI